MDRDLLALLARITDPDPLMRADAARQLGDLPAAAGTTALLNGLEDREWRVRAAAAASLGRLVVAEALYPLSQRLEDQRAEVRSAAAEALGALGSSDATASLVMALDRERDNEVCRLIARSLGVVGDDRALRPLQQLSGSKHWALRHEAADARQRILDRG